VIDVVTQVLDNVFSPLTLAMTLIVLGDIVVERSGVLNIGIDGVVVLSIALSFSLSIALGNPVAVLGVVVAAAVIVALLVSLAVNLLVSSHVLTGLAIGFACYGVGTMAALPYLGTAPRISLSMHWYTVLGLSAALAVATWYVLYYTKAGIAVRAAGNNPYAAEALGVHVWRVRTLALVVGYSLIALGGAVYELGYIGIWSQGLGVGRGWLGLSLAIASMWHPIAALGITAVYSYVETSMWALQLTAGVPAAVINAMPFLTALGIVIAVHLTPVHRRVSPPRALGAEYFREERTA